MAALSGRVQWAVLLAQLEVWPQSSWVSGLGMQSHHTPTRMHPGHGGLPKADPMGLGLGPAA